MSGAWIDQVNRVGHSSHQAQLADSRKLLSHLFRQANETVFGKWHDLNTVAHFVVKNVAVNVVRNQFLGRGHFRGQNSLQEINHFPGMRLLGIVEIDSLCKNMLT